MPKDALRKSHIGILLNDRSSKMEQRVNAAIDFLMERIRLTYEVEVEVEGVVLLDEILAHLNETYGQTVGMSFVKKTTKPTFLRPDGGFLYIRDASGKKRCILVAEAKRQGTNADRLLEGKSRQAQGNAIERLRKNMQGVDCLFVGEDITPFVCFGEGCDFEEGSSILDRVSTMNSFFPLNTVLVEKVYVDTPHREIFKPTSLFFRELSWSPEEMLEIMWQICQKSIAYYDSRYGLTKGLAPKTSLWESE